MNVGTENRMVATASRRRWAMSLLLLFFIGASGVIPCRGQSAATHPSSESVGAGDAPFGRRSNGAGGGPGGERAGERGGGPNHRGEPPSGDEVRAATAFFEEHSPNRMSYFNRLPSDSPLRSFIATDLAWRFRPLRNFKDGSPDLYDLLVRIVTLRDDAFKLAKDGDVEALHAKAAEVVEATLKSRRMRLDLLDKELKRQQDQFATDSADQTALVDSEVARVQDDEQRMIRRVERFKNFRGQSDVEDGTADVLADAALGHVTE